MTLLAMISILWIRILFFYSQLVYANKWKEGEFLRSANGNMIDFQLDFQYDGSEEQVLTNVKGTVPKGRCIVLCGESGCGKSTLLRCVNQLIPQFYEGTLKGFCNINGRDTSKLTIGEVGRMASSVFQDPRSQFFTLNSSTEIAFGLENFGYSHDEMVKIVEEIFHAFHLEKLKNRNVFELSSGERQMIAILSARAVNTEIYLLDEPTANLDYAAVRQLTSLLSVLKEQGRTMMISEHRLYYLQSIADEYWYMEHGQIIKKITKEQMQSFSENQLKEMGLRTTDLNRIHSKVGKKKESAINKHEIKVEQVSFQYHRSDPKVLKGLSMEGKTSEVIALTGANGCGKTTMGKILTGLYRSDSGNIFLDGKKMTAKSLIENGIFIMQEAEFQFFTNSVWNELCYRRKDRDEKEMEELLKKMGLWKCRNQHPFSLSGGQMQKLVLLLAYFCKKPLVVLDEPTAGLDYHSLCDCIDLIKEMQKTKIVFLISHDLELLSEVCTKAYFLKDGKVEKKFDFSDPFAFSQLKDCMEEQPEVENMKRKENKKLEIDPRVKIFIFLLSMIVAIGTDLPLILFVFFAVMIVFLLEGQWKELVSGTILTGGLLASYFLWESVVTAFMISFFPRVIIVCYATLLLVKEKDAQKTLAALRKLHVPEKVIMIFSVTFRFFPVLKKDLSIMSQSLKTRGFFQKISEKIKAAPEYMEILIVPMVFRVIRIAEALSASAETRGISLKGKRDSYVELGTSKVDVVLLGVAFILTVAGFLL